MNGICSLLSRCDSIVMNSNAGDEQVFLNLPETPSPKLQSIWSFTLYNAAETVIFQVFPRIRKNLSPLTGAVGGHIECPDNRISIIGVCGHDRRAKRSSLNCSGPTRRSHFSRCDRSSERLDGKSCRSHRSGLDRRVATVDIIIQFFFNFR